MNSTTTQSRSYSREAGFTLVELLVVIGIIALLISILLPVINKARESGNRVKCMSNQRQIALSLILYDNTYRSLPGAISPAILSPTVVNNTTTNLLTSTSSNPYYYNERQLTWSDPVNIGPTGTNGPSICFTTGGVISTDPNLYRCPSAGDLYESGQSIGSVGTGNALGYSYKLNNQDDTDPAYFFGTTSSSANDINLVTNAATTSATDPVHLQHLRGKKIAEIHAACIDPSTISSASTAYSTMTATTHGSWQGVRSKSDIWMTCDIDSQNWTTGVSPSLGIALTATSALSRPWQPVHQIGGKNGRIWTFFDGHAEYRMVGTSLPSTIQANDPANPS